MTIIRGKRPIPLFKLIKANPPGRYRTPKVPCRLSIPAGRWSDAAAYIAAFSSINNLTHSTFIVGKELVTA